MFVTIKNDNGFSKIIDASEILLIEKIRHLPPQVQIIYKRNKNSTMVDFGDEEEREFFIKELHRILDSNVVEQAPPKEVRELNHLIEEDE
jgi:hypothetical protein